MTNSDTFISIFKSMKVFLLVWFGQLISISGSRLTSFALAVWIYQSSGSVTQLSLISLFAILPRAIFSPLAGVWVDRWDRRWTMIVSDSLAALSTFAIVILFITNHLEIWHIYIANAVSGIGGAFQWPAYMASIMLLVPKQQLGRANGLISLGTAIAEVFSPPLAGFLLGIIHLQGVITIDLGTFVISIIILLCINFPKIPINVTSVSHNSSDNLETLPSSLREKKTFSQSWIQDFYQGLSYLLVNPGLLGIVIFLTLITFLKGGVDLLFTPLILATNSASILGFIFATGGIGMFLGSLAMSIWGSSRRYINNVFIFMLLQSVCVLATGLKNSILIWEIAIFCYSFGTPIIYGSITTILQKKVDLQLQGRILSLVSAIVISSSPMGYLLAGFLADNIFEPLMTTNGLLANSVGLLLGTGKGRGIGLMFVIIGLLMILIIAVMYQNTNLRLVEEQLPDIVND